MTRPHPKTRTIALISGAIAALGLSASAAFAFSSLPSAASDGLQRASDASGQTVPARPDSVGAPTLPDQAGNGPDEDATTEDATTNDAAPDTGAPTDTHGAAVSAVAKAPDTTPDTNHGADVSAVARNNHGQATAAQHRPAGAGKPTDPGKPDNPGKP